jgi:hypothetical protein
MSDRQAQPPFLALPRPLVLGIMVSLVGCGGRTHLFEAHRDGGADGTTDGPQGSGGQGGRADASFTDATDASSRPDIVTPPVSDVAADQARDLPADPRPETPAEAGPDLPDAPNDRFDTLPDTRADGQFDSPRDPLADVRPDLPADATPEVPWDGPRNGDEAGLDTRDADLGDRREIGDASDLGGPGLRVLAGVLAGPGALDGVGGTAQFYFPAGAATDGAGNLYVADAANNTIRKIVLATGEVTTIAGSLAVTGSDDGIGMNARFYSPQGLASDGAGNLYVADSVNSTIRKLVLATGEVTTLAGSAGGSGGTDGPGKTARFEWPASLAYDGAGSLFVADFSGNTIRRVVLATAEVATLAGSFGAAGSQDGTGPGARFSGPQGLASDSAGNLYVADSDNHTIRKIVVAAGLVTTFAGSPGLEGSDDGVGATARFSYPHGLAVDDNGNLLVADFGSNRIRKIRLATAEVTTLAGLSGTGASTDGPGDLAEFDGPHSLAYDSAGKLFVTDSSSHTVREVVLATRAVTTLAGRGRSDGSEDGSGAAARFAYPTGLARDPAGNLLVADSLNHTIRVVTLATGAVRTLVGLAGQGGSRDGTGADARFDFPVGLAYDGAGAVFVADQNNCLIRKVVLATAAVTTIAGSAGMPGSDDGTGGNARFAAPGAVAVDGAGNLFVADTTMHTIRKIAIASGSVTTLAGVAGSPGSDDGVGAGARFSRPAGLACDGTGNLFVADTDNHSLRKIVTATATVTTLGTTLDVPGSDAGSGAAARFQTPAALAIDGAGNLFVADLGDNTVRRVNLASALVTTVVGQTGRWETVPGPLPAYVAAPAGLAVLPSGDLAITDRLENAVLVAQF